MVDTIQLVGLIVLGAMLLAVVVLGVISWARNRGRTRVEDREGGGSGVSGDTTPGDWDGGAGGD
ncbi:hypothetical protein [Paractinoplanes rishiriensis]|uniref:Uncharacterized protein n=1 Tax=Paractinoplanes rishiriensis TaxID=1050105 RepID=A0A919MY50_9ACTN|nr:hypothetical protein [Actinoplanes rishiriensis]GIE99444.1 hypothetical protein Ari01nite_69090 [Actinoplanes rishiriensis]